MVAGLKQAGFEIIEADNGDDAILLAREHKPDLALLDIRMEGKSGFDVAETLRDAYRIPFMFLSAFADSATRQKVQELGAVDYLIKPLEVSQIIPAVEAALARLRGALVAGSTPVTVPNAVELLSDPVPLAVGVLMHRYSMPRTEAMVRLQRQVAQLERRGARTDAAELAELRTAEGRHAGQHAHRLDEALDLAPLACALAGMRREYAPTRKDIDVVDICTPNNLHKEIAIAAAQRSFGKVPSPPARSATTKVGSRNRVKPSARATAAAAVAVARPLWPTSAMCCPRLTRSPFLTSTREECP